MKKTLILGIGNPLFSDEGIGPYAVEELKKYALPVNVDVIDGGTGGFGLIRYFQQYDNIIVIDAVDMNTAPGTIRKLKLSDVEGKTHTCHSLHQTSFTEIVQLANTLGNFPEITIFGVQPENTKNLGGLTPEIKKSMPALIAWLMEEIKKLNSFLTQK
ncbi:MAG: hydrogenase maturation protease [Patescibacteria group bacterium]